MNLTQLSTFRAVMTSASLSDAARKLGRSQPAVSASLKTLEDRLGLKLFERQGRRLVPVPEAHYLLTEVEDILGQISRVRQTMRSLVDARSGSLSLAAMPGPVSMLFPRFIAGQIAGNDGIKLSMFARSSSQIVELARAQNIDFGFADAPDGEEGENLYTAEHISGDCFLALPQAHELAGRARIPLADLDGQPMGTLQPTHAHQRAVRALFRERDLDFDTMIESQTFLPILQFVIAGQCCAILDPLTVVHVQAAGLVSQGIAIRPLAETIRYRYAIFSPRYRPVSVLARRVRAAWRAEVLRLLDSVQAGPVYEPSASSAAETASS
ncbi:MAG: LysR family transcriptional regulator [Alphaproteobacteria bacterium]|nr:MAG: LysR family transcriptional regulator [Alphaproteobacteria bacterium]